MGAEKSPDPGEPLTLDMELDTPVDQPEPTGGVRALQALHLGGTRRTKQPPHPRQRTRYPGRPTASPPRKRRSRSLDGLLKLMQIDSPVVAEETEEAIILSIREMGAASSSEDEAELLDAIQYFVNKATHRSPNGHKMIIIDTEDYRKRAGGIPHRTGVEARRESQKDEKAGNGRSHERPQITASSTSPCRTTRA